MKLLAVVDVIFDPLQSGCVHANYGEDTKGDFVNTEQKRGQVSLVFIVGELRQPGTPQFVDMAERRPR